MQPTWNDGIMECWFLKEFFPLLTSLTYMSRGFRHHNIIPFFQNPWPRPCRHRFRFTMAKFENAANNILNHLSRTRAGQYSIPAFVAEATSAE